MLPIDLTTGDGVVVKRGKFALEVRSQPKGYTLLLLNGPRVVAKVPQSLSGEGGTKPLAYTVPLIVTLRLTASAS